MAVYAFDDFEVDSDRFELRRAGQVVAIEPQVFRILLLLVECRDRLVSKDELFERIWKGRIVSEAALSSRIKSVRQALGDDGAGQRLVKTLRGEGFRFVGRTEQREAARMCAAQEVVEVMSRPLIGVFPFAVDRPDAEYLVDGLAETLIGELAAWRWFPVLSRNSTFAAGRDECTMLERAQVLGVRYAVSGKLACYGNHARLAISLVDVPTGECLLTQVFEDSLSAMMKVQADIAAAILRLITPEVEGAERRRIVRALPANMSAWDLTLKSLWALNQPSQGGLAKALHDLEALIRMDPGSALPWSLKAQVHFEIGLNGWLGGKTEVAHDCFARMLDAARTSIDLDPRGWMGHSLASAGELFAASAYAPARRHADEALRLNPSAGMAHHFSGCIVGFGGDPAEAIGIQEWVYTVDPEYRHTTVIEADLGLWWFLLGEMEQALVHLDASLQHNPANQRALQRRIAVRSRLRDIAGARGDLADLVALGGSIAPDKIRASYPFQVSEHGDTLIAALSALDLEG